MSQTQAPSVRKGGRFSIFSLFVLLYSGTSPSFVSAQSTPSDVWVTAYYAGWSQGWTNNGVLPAQDIDYSAVSHIVHFGLVPRSDGTFDADANSIREDNSRALVQNAHARGVKVLICVGGWGTDRSFRDATSPLRLNGFVRNLTSFMVERGYDGIDIDWEVLEATDAAQYVLFIRTLRAVLDTISPRPLLTAATTWQGPIFAVVAQEFDQINIMTYDLSGPWGGWVTWHNSPLYDGGFRFPSSGALIPSAEGLVNKFSTAGVPLSKIGIGIDFYGYVWSGGTGTATGGVTEPRQGWSSYPELRPNVPYSTLMRDYYWYDAYRWDSAAGAAYLSLDTDNDRDDKFISYDNEYSCIEKVRFARQKSMGGVFIWELGGGKLPQSFPNRDRLLRSVRNEWRGTTDYVGTPSTLTPRNATVGVPVNPTLTWTTDSSASWYQVQLAEDSTFSTVTVDRRWILHPDHQLSALAAGSTYYARVRAYSPSSTGEWSAPTAFTTTPDDRLPVWWQYRSATGSNATVLIPETANPRIGERPLQTGDAVGVFFERDGRAVCAGYGVWQEGANLAVTAWGDDPITSEKDGFAQGEKITVVLWNNSTQREHFAVRLAYASGDGRFASDAIHVIGELIGSSMREQVIPLARGWNTISSYILPFDRSMSALIQTVSGSFTLMKDGMGRVFWPDSAVFDLTDWDVMSGYQIHMKEVDTLLMLGESVTPESTAIDLSTGWNLAAYLRQSSMVPESAFSSIAGFLTLVKDNEGNVYWPGFGINTLGRLEPGRGYKIHVSGAATLLYPGNGAGSTGGGFVSVGRSYDRAGFPQKSPAHYPGVPNTGSNALVLLETPLLRTGDEVAARMSDGTIVGTAMVEEGRAMITVWGDDPFSEEVKEGPAEGDLLSFTGWSESRQEEHDLRLQNASEVISGVQFGRELPYAAESAVLASADVVPSSFFLEESYPNPFNSRTTITFGVGRPAGIQLDIYTLTGERVVRLRKGQHAPGIYRVPFDAGSLASGVYLVRLRSKAFLAVDKIMLIR